MNAGRVGSTTAVESLPLNMDEYLRNQPIRFDVQEADGGWIINNYRGSSGMVRPIVATSESALIEAIRRLLIKS